MSRILRKEIVCIDGIRYQFQYILSDNPEITDHVHVQVCTEDGDFLFTAENKEEGIRELKNYL